MIVGNGMLAKAFGHFVNNERIVIFASGVSSSKETSDANFKREEKLLDETIKQNKNAVIVYFSTCGIYDDSVNKTHYYLHKIKMEQRVKQHYQFYIFRLPQVVGVTQSPTIVRSFFQTILADQELTINKNSTRNLIDVADVFNIGRYLIDHKIYLNEVTNIATPYNVPVFDIALMIAKISGHQLRYKLKDIGTAYQINVDKLKALSIYSNTFHDKYFYDLLIKYYHDMKV